MTEAVIVASISAAAVVAAAVLPRIRNKKKPDGTESTKPEIVIIIGSNITLLSLLGALFIPFGGQGTREPLGTIQGKASGPAMLPSGGDAQRFTDEAERILLASSAPDGLVYSVPLEVEPGRIAVDDPCQLTHWGEMTILGFSSSLQAVLVEYDAPDSLVNSGVQGGCRDGTHLFLRLPQ